ncbi:metalloproteinase inhibitor 2-like isoform X1 [Syngnathoides biaculeatus]|uniref:metalloproteinase inhibitor 2-like isoform X1 n=1 Tax=Syngnathoides biaculeatus TaxID=300417 RepID=UPI002ADDFAC1|nr:metalloproteinase inhibitor 2-like isoform X1 [Syngnathoides biaculeatus]
MSWSAKSLALPLVLLCLWGLQEGTRACKCVSRHPQEAFCQSDVAIKAKVVGKVDTTLNPIKYRIKQIKMFKGPEKRFCYFYTEPDSAACGVNLSNNTEYLLSGRLASDGSMHVSLCDFYQRWEDLSAMQKRGLVQRYQTGCDCKITRCVSTPCGRGPTECLWTDFLMAKVFRHLACIKRSDGSCAWYTTVA